MLFKDTARVDKGLERKEHKLGGKLIDPPKGPKLYEGRNPQPDLCGCSSAGSSEGPMKECFGEGLK